MELYKLLTIVIPCKNESKIIETTLNLLNQQNNIEKVNVIVSDSSTDNTTFELESRINDKFNLKIIQGGLPSIARNNGAKHVKTPFILFLDADIFILDDKQAQKLTNAMELRGSRFNTLDEILDVLYGDAAEEVQFKEAKQMVQDLTNTLNGYKNEVNNALTKINKTDLKALNDTKKAIDVEKKRIDMFIAELNKRLSNKENPYLTVIQFVLGPRILEDLAQKFLAKK